MGPASSSLSPSASLLPYPPPRHPPPADLPDSNCVCPSSQCNFPITATRAAAQLIWSEVVSEICTSRLTLRWLWRAPLPVQAAPVERDGVFVVFMVKHQASEKTRILPNLFVFNLVWFTTGNTGWTCWMCVKCLTSLLFFLFFSPCAPAAVSPFQRYVSCLCFLLSRQTH